MRWPNTCPATSTPPQIHPVALGCPLPCGQGRDGVLALAHAAGASALALALALRSPLALAGLGSGITMDPGRSHAAPHPGRSLAPSPRPVLPRGAKHPNAAPHSSPVTSGGRVTYRPPLASKRWEATRTPA